jgi:hypothetical protein
MPSRFVQPKAVEFIEHRWHVIIRIVDRFDTERWFKASADSYDTEGSGIYFAEVDAHGESIGGEH